MCCPPLYSQDTLGAGQRQRDLTGRRLNTKAKIIESHKNKTQANHYGSKHITHTHTFTHMDYRTTPESWPGHAPYRSVLACVQNKLGLSVGNRGGLRPCCLAGAEGAAGCQWSVPAGASGNGVTLTSTPILTPVSSWVQGRVQGLRVNSTPTAEQLDSLSWMSSFWPPSKQEASQAPDVWAVSMKSLSEHRSVSAHRPINMRLLRFMQGQSDDRKRSYIFK